MKCIPAFTMANFSHDLSDWLAIDFDSEWLEENIRWKDFGTGVRLGRIAREDSTSLVLYDADPEAVSYTHLTLPTTPYV